MTGMSVPEPITSLQNPQLKRLVRLRSRREREAEGVWLIEGARELGRAQSAGVVLQQVFICPELFSPDAQALYPDLDPSGQLLTPLSRPAFEKVSGRENPDGLLALAEPPSPELAIPTGDMLVLLLMGLEKPGNLGALLRTADGAGVDAVLVVGGTDLGNPGVIRASQGSLFTQPVLSLPEDEALAWLREHGFTLVACTPEAEVAYWDAPLTGRVALCLGSEHDGLPALWRDRADLLVGIPMRGRAVSLNVSVAGALVLYDALRHRQFAARGGRA